MTTQRLRRARLAAFPAGEYVGQEGFMPASQILALARRAGVSDGQSVLDLCCGSGGPGRLITRELGCCYLGVDCDSRAIARARRHAHETTARFRIARVPPVPDGDFDVVLVLETMLAFPDKAALLRGVFAALGPGGRFACTLESGRPLTTSERSLMPDADTVWPIPLRQLVSCLEQTGLSVRCSDDCTREHLRVVDALVGAYAAEAARAPADHADLDRLLASHRIWSEWLRQGRVRKVAVVAEKTER